MKIICRIDISLAKDLSHQICYNIKSYHKIQQCQILIVMKVRATIPIKIVLWDKERALSLHIHPTILVDLLFNNP